MARTWVYTRRNRLPLRVFDALGRLLVRHGREVSRPADELCHGVRSILVVEFWNIGDVVLATPFLAQLRAIFPDAKITLLGQPHAAEVLENSALVDEIITFDFPWTSARGRYDPRRYDRPALRKLFRTLRGRKFDLAFESRMDPRAKIVLALSGARRRVAYDYGGCDWLLTDSVPYESLDRHRLEDWTRMLDPFGGARNVPVPRLTVSRSEASWAKGFLALNGVRPGERVVAVHPGASSPHKKWPLERFAAVVSEMLSWGGVRIIAIEDPQGYGAELASIAGVRSVRPSLRQMLALLAEADVLVCNDSGPMHLAAAVGTPTVGVFHPHAAREFAAFGSGHHVLKPAEERSVHGSAPQADALLGVEVASVVSAVNTVLSESSLARCATGS
ncbi:MAG: glycosyltransferase family 9 protein [Gemmatimonadaceae bacterium]|nr:glycosyltransferase family 9 protein [Gemmatimonadaceae bacterium]